MLVSENHRLKARLAAREGEEQFFAFILNKPQDESYVRELQERLACVFKMTDVSLLTGYKACWSGKRAH